MEEIWIVMATNNLLYGMLKQGFYIIKPLHCYKSQEGQSGTCGIGACRVGFAGMGYLYVDRAIIETYDSFQIKVMQSNEARISDLKPSDLEFISNAESYMKTYLERAKFIESKLNVLKTEIE